MPYNLSKHTVVVDSNGRKVPIYLSRPTIPEKRPAVIIVHEWWGVNDQIRSIADRYSSLGYVAAAPDLYGGLVAKDRNEAAKLAGSVSFELSTQILNSALDFLTMKDFVNRSKVGLEGFCFGGTHAFNFVCESKKITAAAIFYASALPEKKKLANIAAPLFIVYGGKDQLVKLDQVRELETTLKKLKKNVQMEIYPDAGHAFCNETGASYNEEAAKDSCNKALRFFESYLPVPKA